MLKILPITVKPREVTDLVTATKLLAPNSLLYVFLTSEKRTEPTHKSPLATTKATPTQYFNHTYCNLYC